MRSRTAVAGYALRPACRDCARVDDNITTYYCLPKYIVIVYNSILQDSIVYYSFLQSIIMYESALECTNVLISYISMELLTFNNPSADGQLLNASSVVDMAFEGRDSFDFQCPQSFTNA